jgi:endoglucanase
MILASAGTQACLAAPDPTETTSQVSSAATSSGRLVGKQSGRCLDVKGASQANGTEIDIWDCGGGSNQQWTLTAAQELRVYGGSKCLDVTGQATAPGTAVELWDCNGGNNQKWTVNSNGTIVGVQSKLCLDVTGASTADGARVQIWGCNGGQNQQWSWSGGSSSTTSSSGSSSGSASGSSSGSSGSSSGSTSGSSGPSGTPVGVHGRLHIQGNKFVDEHGSVVTLHGMSMYDWSQQGQQFYNAQAVGNLAHEEECAVLRVPLNPSNYPGAVGRIETVMNACIANGIYCILDWHPGSTSDVNAATSYFVEMAQKYHDYPNIMYEPWNEPNGPGSDWTSVKAYHEHVLHAVRPIDPENIFILGTPQWDQLPQDAAANPITDEQNVAYTVHFYAASHPLSSFEPGINTALNAGLAIFVTEYGGVSANGNGSLDLPSLQQWWNYLDAHNIGNCNWAVETNTETSSVFTTNASSTGPWPSSQITYSGSVIFPYIKGWWQRTITP